MHLKTSPMIAWHDGSLAVSPIPVNRVSMVIGQRVNLINKPAATRPDASDNSMTEATSMGGTSINEYLQVL